MIRKTMRIGEIRTSIKLEGEFWQALRDLAEPRGMRLSNLVNEIAAAHPDRSNLASTLRVYALEQWRQRFQQQQRELDRLSLAGGTNDLARLLEACPMPALLLDAERMIRLLNRAFGLWLNVDARATVGQKLDNIMLLRGPGMKEMWHSLAEGRLGRAGFNATYVSPGKVRTAQALAIALAGCQGQTRRGYVVLFETLPSRS
jgi:predicted DNA-binding ribbon-helix-helix protein